jgi:hypothetical protein
MPIDFSVNFLIEYQRLAFVIGVFDYRKFIYFLFIELIKSQSFVFVIESFYLVILTFF